MSKKTKDSLIPILAAVIIFSSLLQPASLSAEGKMPGAERTARFSRGLNLAFWFWLNRGEIVPLEKRVSLNELKNLRKMGITFLRVPVDMANIYDPGRADRLNPEKLALLFEGLKKIIGCGLAVNFDLHSISQQEGGSDYSGPLGKDEKFTAEFYLFWENLAGKLAAFPPDWLIVEPMNEPVFLGEEDRWPPIQEKLISIIRKKLSSHTILATGAFWSNPPALLRLTPLADENVWYVFHFYYPHIFTHQGATWSSDWLKSLRQVPYPSSPEAVQRAISLVKEERLKKYLQDYGQEFWNASRVEQEILNLVRWAESHGVRLFCNEFGAYRDYCLPLYRTAWITDVRQILEKYGIGWAMWEYDGSFGLVYRKGRKVEVDQKIARALGLKVR